MELANLICQALIVVFLYYISDRLYDIGAFIKFGNNHIAEINARLDRIETQLNKLESVDIQLDKLESVAYQLERLADLAESEALNGR